jgi:hypothetical protein
MLDIPFEPSHSTTENLFFNTPNEITSISVDEIQNYAPGNSFK